MSEISTSFSSRKRYIRDIVVSQFLEREYSRTTITTTMSSPNYRNGNEPYYYYTYPQKAFRYHHHASFLQRFQEYARFGESTVENAHKHTGISPLNCYKWFKEAGLFYDDVINPAEIDIVYKQLFPLKQRINEREFCQLVETLSHTNKKSYVTYEALIEALTESGPPKITDIQWGKSNCTAYPLHHSQSQTDLHKLLQEA